MGAAGLSTSDAPQLTPAAGAAMPAARAAPALPADAKALAPFARPAAPAAASARKRPVPLGDAVAAASTS
eukprot:13799510-Alexandrium_andersonii.AAC.1